MVHVETGNTYLSLTEAANSFNYSNNVSIRNGLRTGKFVLATSEQVDTEKLRRAQGDGEPVKVIRSAPLQTGVSRAIIINGVRYASMSEAGKVFNVSPQAISKSLKKNREGYSYADLHLPLREEEG